MSACQAGCHCPASRRVRVSCLPLSHHLTLHTNGHMLGTSISPRKHENTSHYTTKTNACTFLCTRCTFHSLPTQCVSQAWWDCGMQVPHFESRHKVKWVSHISSCNDPILILGQILSKRPCLKPQTKHHHPKGHMQMSMHHFQQ